MKSYGSFYFLNFSLRVGAVLQFVSLAVLGYACGA
jgi:hypothetical protein